jgi:hypothetical protein
MLEERKVEENSRKKGERNIMEREEEKRRKIKGIKETNEKKGKKDKD